MKNAILMIVAVVALAVPSLAHAVGPPIPPFDPHKIPYAGPKIPQGALDPIGQIPGPVIPNIPGAGGGNGAVLDCLTTGVDCDDDGVPNATDNCLYVPNGDCNLDPLNCDIDDNGVVTNEEKAAGGQKDSDAQSDNGVAEGYSGDACEDSDGDGVLDYLDGDMDKDGIPDSLDNCPEDYNTGQHDRDNDDVGDVCDNCMKVSNPDQADDDDDGFGNVCAEDSDGDGVANTLDNCPMISNPDQADSDQDFKGDACDTSNPNAGGNAPVTQTPWGGGAYNGNCSLIAGGQAGTGAMLAAILWVVSAAIPAIRRRRR